MLRPSLKMPLWAAVGLPAAAYVLRGILRGMYFAPDLPADAVVIGVWILVIAVAAAVRTSSTNHGGDELTDDMDDERGTEGH